MLDNINKPTSPIVNKLIAVSQTVGGGLVGMGMNGDDHFTIGLGAGIMFLGGIVGVLLPSKS